ncbi:MAG: hypothetical protein KDK71_04530 [Chlamydiia bacterium]|nr:hypothetical protein [Chlamydiia bacterium]
MKVAMKDARPLHEKEVPCAKLETERGLTLTLLSEDRPYIRKFILSMVTTLPFRDTPPPSFSLEPAPGGLLLTTVHFSECTPQLKGYFERMLHEFELGALSPYHAARILEMKVFSMDEKRELIQDRILKAIHRFPTLFDYDLFSEMQQFFLAQSDQYFRTRKVREIAQTLVSLYVVRKKIETLSEKKPKLRHVEVKLFRRHLSLPFGEERVLSVVVGMNALRQHEVFKRSHLIKAIQNILPEATFVSGSDYQEKEKSEGLHLLSLDIEKEGGFTQEEVADLKRWLPRALKGKVEHLQRSLFMPRNEEEILKHVLTLGKELRFAKDAPQVILSFERQTDAKLIFTVILARLLLPKMPSLEEVLLASPLRPTIDRIKQLGVLRKKYPKEAAVFKVELPLGSLLREDHSIDLYKARQAILSQLRAVFGPVRDYNGGMISKQNEAFRHLEKALGPVSQTHHYLLEQFFHSLYPLEKRSLLNPHLLKEFFLLLLEALQSQKSFIEKEVHPHLFVVGESRYLQALKEASPPLLTLDLEYDEKKFTGLVSRQGDRIKIDD